MNRIAMPVQVGRVIDYTNDGADPIAVGDVVPMTTFCGVAEVDIPVGEMGAVAITEVWEVPCIPNVALAPGELVYWNPTSKQATSTPTDNVQLGVCIMPKVNGQTRVRVKIGVWFGTPPTP